LQGMEIILTSRGSIERRGKKEKKMSDKSEIFMTEWGNWGVKSTPGGTTIFDNLDDAMIYSKICDGVATEEEKKQFWNK